MAGDSDIAKLQRFRVDGRVGRNGHQKSFQVRPYLLVNRNACGRRQQLRKTQHIVEVLANVLGIHLGALRLACHQFQPCDRLERNQAVFTDPRQAIDFAASRHDECVVGLVQQNGGQAGNRFVQRYRCELTCLSRVAIRRALSRTARSSAGFWNR